MIRSEYVSGLAIWQLCGLSSESGRKAGAMPGLPIGPWSARFWQSRRPRRGPSEVASSRRLPLRLPGSNLASRADAQARVAHLLVALAGH